MSICPPQPDTHRRCFSPCPVGTFCECEGAIVGRIFGIDILENPTVPVGMMVTTLPAKAIETQSAATAGRGPQDESPVGVADAPNTPSTPSIKGDVS